MQKRLYSAGAVKFMFWFMEFRQVVSLLAEGKTMDEIKRLNTDQNIFGAPTPARAKQMFSTVSARVNMLEPSFVPVFMGCDIASQKMFALVAAMAHDTLFFEFVYEVIRDKMALGVDTFKDSDISIFFKNKQEQDEKVAQWTDATLRRLGQTYKNALNESGLSDKGKEERIIYRPILDENMQNWLLDHDMKAYLDVITGVM